MVSDMKQKLGPTKKKEIPKEMLDQYKRFQDSWYKRMKAIHQEWIGYSNIPDDL